MPSRSATSSGISSTSYTLADLSTRFPQYLAQTRSAGPEGDWPQFLIDLATLERTYSEVFDGPGCEGEPLLPAEALVAVPAERWADFRLEPAPCLRLLSLRFPVHEYALAVHRGEHPEIPAPQADLAGRHPPRLRRPPRAAVASAVRAAFRSLLRAVAGRGD